MVVLQVLLYSQFVLYNFTINSQYCIYLGQQFRKRFCLKIFLSLALVAILFSWVEPFGNYSTCHKLRVCTKKLIFLFLNQNIIEQPHEISNNVVCVTSKGSDQPSHTHSFIIALRGDWSWNNLYGHSPPFRWNIQEGCCQLQAKVCARSTGKLLVQACPGKSVVRWTARPAMTIAVDLGRKATKQTKQNHSFC